MHRALVAAGLCLALTGCPGAIMGVGMALTVLDRVERAAERAVEVACRAYAAEALLVAARGPASPRVVALMEYASAACANPPTDGDPVEFALWIRGIVRGIEAESGGTRT